MRDPNRCYKITNALAANWKIMCPDMRFMQLICNFQSWLGNDGFYLEDEDFVEKFAEFLAFSS